MRRLTPIAALAALAPGGSFAQGPPINTMAMPDVHAEAGRDLTGLHRLLNSARTELDPQSGQEGKAAFERFLTSIRKAVAKDKALSKEVQGNIGTWKSDVRELVLRGYLTRVHGRSMRDTLSQAVALKTVGGADAGFDTWLMETTAGFGLKATALGKGPGAGWEIVVGGRKKPVLLVTHVDVEDTDAALWSRDPWAGKLAGRSVHGRGATGGKAGLVAALYALRALRDSGTPLKHGVRLYVGTDGTAFPSKQAGLMRWAKTQKSRLATYVLGVPFAATRGESGIARVTVSSPPGGAPDAATQGWRVVSATSQGPRHGLPQTASIILDPRGMSSRRALGALRRTLTLMRKSEPEIQPDVVEDGNYVKITFRGRPGPAAEPSLGRNALADLTTFLADYLGLFPDHRGRLVRFVSAYVGQTTDCAKLGLDAKHPEMPAATCTAVAIGEDSAAMWVTLDIRWPQGRATGDVAKAVKARAEELTQNLGGKITVKIEGSPPSLVPADDKNLQIASAAYKELLRKDPTPRAIPRATYARHIKGAIGLGPAAARTPLRPGPNEAMLIEDLEGAARLYLTIALRQATK